MEHTFTKTIKRILADRYFDGHSEEIFDKSELLQYINKKTRSAERGSKSRASFGCLYAIYSLVEDYIKQGYSDGGDYSKYEGAEFSPLLRRMRELPFGEKLQNHYLNNRVNHEFRKFFPNAGYLPISHLPETKRYWINETLLKVFIGKDYYNISRAVIEIIDAYIEAKQDAFQRFIQKCEELKKIENESPKEVITFIHSLLEPNVDARLFEIVSYSILKAHYIDQKMIWGLLDPSDNDKKDWAQIKLQEDNLKLFKTGRTNANDGGIDFVMKPLGRFFQVTETLDFKKYFLDIDKIERYPITFVVKSTDSVNVLLDKIRDSANKSYGIDAIVQRYMDCIEEIINIPELTYRFDLIVKKGELNNVLEEIIIQSKVEFNLDDGETDSDADPAIR